MAKKRRKTVLIRKGAQMTTFGGDKAKANLKVLFPQAQIIPTKNGNIKIEYKPNFKTKFNANLNRSQVFLDNKVIIALQGYVSKKYGVQEMSIRYASYPRKWKSAYRSSLCRIPSIFKAYSKTCRTSWYSTLGAYGCRQKSIYS